MLESVSAVKCRGTFVFGFGFKAVAASGDVILDEFKEFRADSFPAMFLFDVYFLDPDNLASRLLRVGVGKNAVAEDDSVIFKYKSVTVRGARKEKFE